jgi:hypothetical protein
MSTFVECTINANVKEDHKLLHCILNIGLSVNGNEPAAQLRNTLLNLYRITGGNYDFKMKDNSAYDGVSERCIIVRTSMSRYEIKKLSTLVSQECIAVKWREDDRAPELVWAAGVEPYMGFLEDYFANF